VAAFAAVAGTAIAVAAAGIDGAVIAAAAAGLALGLGVCFVPWLGGVTGDTLGATAELTETAVLVVAVALTGT
jgi:cobalamin synthase